jgi:hypothetical protein
VVIKPSSSICAATAFADMIQLRIASASVAPYARGQGEYAHAFAQAEAVAANEQKALMRAVERVAENAETERTELEARLAAADASVERLHQAT